MHDNVAKKYNILQKFLKNDHFKLKTKTKISLINNYFLL